MVFHLPWCAAFCITICLHLLLGVGGWGVLCLCFRAEVVAFWHPCLLHACGGHRDDAGVVISFFFPLYSSPHQVKSLCLCLLFGQQMLEWHARRSSKLDSSENVLFKKCHLRWSAFLYTDVISGDINANATSAFLHGWLVLSFQLSDWNSVLGAIWMLSPG